MKNKKFQVTFDSNDSRTATTPLDRHQTASLVAMLTALKVPFTLTELPPKPRTPKMDED